MILSAIEVILDNRAGVWLPLLSGCGSVWLERCVRDAEAGGSNPLTPTIFLHFRRIVLTYDFFKLHAERPVPQTCAKNKGLPLFGAENNRRRAKELCHGVRGYFSPFKVSPGLTIMLCLPRESRAKSPAAGSRKKFGADAARKRPDLKTP